MTLLFIYLLIAIGVSFLCSVLEAVLLSITPSYLEKLSIERPRSGRLIGRVKERLDESLSSILILNTFAHTMGAAGVGSQAVQIFGAASRCRLRSSFPGLCVSSTPWCGFPRA